MDMGKNVLISNGQPQIRAGKSKKRKILILPTIIVILLVIIVCGWIVFQKKKSVKTPTEDRGAEQAGDQISKYKKQLGELSEKAKSGNVGDLQNYAIAQYATGDQAGAEKTYRDQIAKGGDGAVVRNSLANALRDQKKYAEAEEQYKLAIEKDGAYVNAYCNLGNMYQYLMSDPQKAIELYKNAISKNPGKIDLYIQLGLAYEGSGDVVNSKDLYNKALGIDQNNAAAKTALERLKK